MKKIRIAAVSVMSLAVSFGLLMAPDVARSEAPAQVKMCQGCHGQDGISMKETVPTIAGISAFVHADYLYAYREGVRTCDDPKSKAMCGMSAKLTDEQIEGLAEYYAGLKFKPAAQKFDADKAAVGAGIHEQNCAKCHSDGGSNPDDDASLLAGQWLAYLQTSLAQFVSGSREQPNSMQKKIEGLSETDVDALAHYYASQQ